MIHAEGALRQSGKGRREIDDREQVLGYVSARLAQGMNMSAATRHGLKIFGYRIGRDGKSRILVLLREMTAATLERRYRKLRGQLDDAIVWQNSAPCLVNARYLGISAPRTPLAYGEKPLLTRGRPRKIRRG